VMMDKVELTAKTRKFAIKVFKFVNRFSKSEASRIVTYQLLKSASSVAANYRSSIYAKSNDDFINKLKIVLEEADESNFWLVFSSDVGLASSDDPELISLVAESRELIAIFTASIKTLKSRKGH
jgi:four helix bundle protein